MCKRENAYSKSNSDVGKWGHEYIICSLTHKVPLKKLSKDLNGARPHFQVGMKWKNPESTHLHPLWLAMGMSRLRMHDLQRPIATLGVRSLEGRCAVNLKKGPRAPWADSRCNLRESHNLLPTEAAACLDFWTPLQVNLQLIDCRLIRPPPEFPLGVIEMPMVPGLCDFWVHLGGKFYCKSWWLSSSWKKVLYFFI